MNVIYGLGDGLVSLETVNVRIRGWIAIHESVTANSAPWMDLGILR